MGAHFSMLTVSRPAPGVASHQRLSTWKTPARVHGLPYRVVRPFGVELCGDPLEAQTLTLGARSQFAHVVEDHLLVRPESLAHWPTGGSSVRRATCAVEVLRLLCFRHSPEWPREFAPEGHERQ